MESSRVILALDMYDLGKAEDIARMAEGKIAAIKVNWPIVMTNGVEAIKKLSKYAKVLCDFKVADIPNTNRLIAKKASESAAWGIITHLFTGRDSLEAIISEAGGMKVFGVVAMSHPGASQFLKGHWEHLLSLAKDTGIYGIITPGNDCTLTAEIKAQSGGLKIATPGVGAQGGSAGESIRSGADYIIAGRSIYEAEDPIAALDALNREVDSALKNL